LTPLKSSTALADCISKSKPLLKRLRLQKQPRRKVKKPLLITHPSGSFLHTGATRFFIS